MHSIIILSDVEDYLNSRLPKGHREKIEDFIQLLKINDGILDQPYSKYLGSKIGELRVNFGELDHRILFTILPDKKILLLIAYKKKSKKVGPKTINKAVSLRNCYLRTLNSKKMKKK